MNKIVSSMLIFSIIFLLFSSNVLADGGLYKHIITYEKDEWVPITQNEQISVINYENGKEILIISVRGELEGNEAAWIFPIPAKPEETTIDIIREFPKFSGYEVKSKVGYELHEKVPIFALTQIYPAIFYFFTFSGRMGGYGRVEERWMEDRGIIIYEHLEKGGLTAELVTAEDENKLNAYLKEKKLELPHKSLSLIKEYIGKEYSFIISWVSDIIKYKLETGGNVLAIKAEFPARDLYYPLKLTSVYGGNKNPHFNLCFWSC
jgi:hypothetical protein